MLIASVDERIAAEQVRSADKAMRVGAALAAEFVNGVESSALEALGSALPFQFAESYDAFAQYVAFVHAVGLRDWENLIERESNYSTLFLSGSRTGSRSLRVAREAKRIADRINVNLGNLQRIRSKTIPKVKRALTNVADRINEEIHAITKSKLGTKNATKRLKAKLKELGLSPSNPAYAGTLLRTHGQMAYNAAQWRILQADKAVWGFRYVTMGDDRVRPAHRKLEGMTRRKDDAVWEYAWPPNGYNCRCQCVPIYGKGKATRLPANVRDLVDVEFQSNAGIDYQ